MPGRARIGAPHRPHRPGSLPLNGIVDPDRGGFIMTYAVRMLAMAGALMGATGPSAIESSAQEGDGLAVYRNDRHGFLLRYPAAQFIALPAATESALQFVSKDGKARLLVGTLPNVAGKSLRDYRSFIMQESYAGADITYAPVRDNWFVLSGTRNGMLFYQRVNFVCGGRGINSWTMLFPVSEKATYQPVIEQVHRAYRVGTGNCGSLARS
jgi:hypothetical protein